MAAREAAKTLITSCDYRKLNNMCDSQYQIFNGYQQTYYIQLQIKSHLMYTLQKIPSKEVLCSSKSYPYLLLTLMVLLYAKLIGGVYCFNYYFQIKKAPRLSNLSYFTSGVLRFCLLYS